jgi:hypothetical protein
MRTDRRTDRFMLHLVEVSFDTHSVKTYNFQMLMNFNFMNQIATVLHSERYNATPSILNCFTHSFKEII